MNKAKFQEVMKERTRIMEETYDEWDDGIEKCRKEILCIIKEDISGFIEYLRTDCRSQEFIFISEEFEEIVKECNSQALIDAFREVINTRFQAEDGQYSISKDLEDAISLQEERL